MKTRQRISHYVNQWEGRGYDGGIPDEVPEGLDDFAPSYKAIAIALLKCDMHLTSLGYSAPKSKWYMELKRIEIERRNEVPKRNTNT